jgi:SlyX protein
MEKETEDRIINLETKLAFLEDYVQKLQDVSVEHTDEIEKLREENKLISSRFRELQDSLEDIPNRKPPHY